MKPTFTSDQARKIAHAAAWDAGRRSARAAGRKVWTREDFDAAVAEFRRLIPETESLQPGMSSEPPSG